MSLPRARSHASANWPGVHFFARAISSIFCTSHIAAEIVRREARVPPPRIGFGKIALAGDGAGEKPAAERRVGDEGDIERARRSQHFFRLGAVKERELVLHGGDRMHRVRAADGFRSRLADAERAHFALRDELRHGAECFFHRHGRVDPVLIIKIDHINAEPLEALLAGTDDVVGAALGDLALASAEIAEFGRQHHLAAAGLDGLADQLLVMAEAVHVGRVEER